MKALHRRRSFINRIPTRSLQPATHAPAARLSFGLSRVRHRDRTMRTQVQSPGNGFNAWNLRALWVSIRRLVHRGESDRHMRTPEEQGRASVLTTIALRPTVTLLPAEGRLSPGRIEAGRALTSSSERHLWLVLRSEQHRREAYWETAGFLAIWLSGLIGIAICML